MNLIDDRILELLSDDGPLPINEIESNDRILWGDQYIGRRCRLLTEYGLLIHIGNGVYQITDEGESYLAGELHASELEPSD